jgi:hypothetical protein
LRCSTKDAKIIGGRNDLRCFCQGSTLISPISDEDRQIYALRVHKALKHWAIDKLQAIGVVGEETYGNDSRGDIKISDPSTIHQSQALLKDLNCQFNEDASSQSLQTPTSDDPHLGIKSSYLYGQEVDEIIGKRTVVGVIGASSISGPSEAKLNNSGIVYVENIPSSEFMEES